MKGYKSVSLEESSDIMQHFKKVLDKQHRKTPYIQPSELAMFMVMACSSYLLNKHSEEERALFWELLADMHDFDHPEAIKIMDRESLKKQLKIVSPPPD